MSNFSYYTAFTFTSITFLGSLVLAAAPYFTILAPVAALNIGLPFIISIAVASVIISLFSLLIIKKNNELSKKEDELKNTNNKLEETKTELKNANDELSKTKTDLKNANDELSKKNDELKNTNNKLEETKTDLRNANDELSKKDDE